MYLERRTINYPIYLKKQLCPHFTYWRTLDYLISKHVCLFFSLKKSYKKYRKWFHKVFETKKYWNSPLYFIQLTSKFWFHFTSIKAFLYYFSIFFLQFFSKIDKRTPTFIFPQSLADQTKGIVSNPTQKKIVHILLTYVEYHLRNREIQMWQMVFERIRENDIFNGFCCIK